MLQLDQVSKTFHQALAGAPARTSARADASVKPESAAKTRVQATAPVRWILRDLSLSVAAGEYIAVTGESGVGKSTLLNLIAGLDRPDSGRVSLEGRDLAMLDDTQRTLLRRARIGFVFQAFHLLPYLTVAENVGLTLSLNGQSGTVAAERVRQLLGGVGLPDRADSYPRELSGGELQRVAVARALAHRPALVLADEPTGNLDAAAAREVLALLREQLKQDGAAGILVTHSQAAAATTDRQYVMRDGGLFTAP